MSTPTDERFPATRRLAWAAALLLLPGLWLRLHALEWTEFSGDELSIMYDSYRAGHEHIALHGIPASIGLPLPNFLLYLLALPLTISREPTTIVVFVALLNLLGLACLYRLLARSVGTLGALCGVALFASAPWPMMFARKVWNPDFLFPFAAFLYLLLASQHTRPRSWKCALAIVSWVLLCGFHASAWMLIVPLALWIWIFRVPFDRRGLAIGAGLALLLLAPYGYYFAESGFDDLASAIAMRRGQPVASTSFFSAFFEHANASLEASTAGGFAAAGPGACSFVARAFFFWTVVAAMLAWIRAPWIVWRARRGLTVPEIDRLLVLGVTIHATLLIVYAFARFPILLHYYAVLLPIPTFFALWLGWRCAQRIGAWPLVAACALVVVAHSVTMARYFDGLQSGTGSAIVSGGPPFAPFAKEWRAQIARLFDAIDDDHAQERAQQDRWRQAFAASGEVLLRYDPRHDTPPAHAQGRLVLHAGEQGLEVEGSTAVDMLVLPEFDLGGHGRALLHLWYWSPKDVMGCVFYATQSSPDFGRGRALELRVQPGENEIYLELPGSDVRGGLMLRLPARHWTLRAAELRRVAD